jgi:hypothetical protein
MATYIVDRQVEGYYGSEQMKRMDRDRAKADAERNGGHSIKGSGGRRPVRPNQ